MVQARIQAVEAQAQEVRSDFRSCDFGRKPDSKAPEVLAVARLAPTRERFDAMSDMQQVLDPAAGGLASERCLKHESVLRARFHLNMLAPLHSGRSTATNGRRPVK